MMAGLRPTTWSAASPCATSRCVRSGSSTPTTATRKPPRADSGTAGTTPATRPGRDADGYFWFEGRDDDVITSSAYRIGPFEVESALLEHPAIAEAAVVGKHDPERTQIVTAFCVLAAGHQPGDDLARELQDHTKRLTAPYKYPREIHFVTELPKTVSGKIRRSELREGLRAGR
jgi:acyl-coenzyme A synthetase/AMP-(fatty) acid ligase